MTEADRQRVLAARAGDRRAFDGLVADHLPRVLGIARAITDRAAADDVVQIALLRAWRSLGALEQPERFGGWLSVIVRNTARNWLRDHAGDAALPEDHDPVDPRTERVDASDEVERLRRAVARLPEDLREVIRLRYTAELSYAEIADALELPIGRVRDRLYRARQALQALLA